ncbi:hypothetical protein [Jannaschia sp. M317]|uniref:hypothetical protein n=1 Tax=Jannaschia sp. M317 TaxID=2867011 RepID=UPI0021A5991F|nr:hypothetical protein [Jannaschia sp. M317]UWQ16906.1 hypothetical protein K3551_13525 [Jannaschia sp. M317]
MILTQTQPRSLPTLPAIGTALRRYFSATPAGCEAERRASREVLHETLARNPDGLNCDLDVMSMMTAGGY